MSDGGSGTNVSALYRSAPHNNIVPIHREQRLNTFDDRRNRDLKVSAQRYDQTRSVSSDRRPVCSPSEYFCLETSNSDSLRDRCSAAGVNGYLSSVNMLSGLRTDDLNPHQSAADKTTELNSRISRRSGIPVSSMLWFTFVYLC